MVTNSAEPSANEHLQFLMDGLLSKHTPVLLVVADSALLFNLASEIYNGRSPWDEGPAARGRLLKTDALSIASLTVENVSVFFDELATTDDWLLVENVADCLESVAGRNFLTELVDRVGACKLTALIGSTTADGIKTLNVKCPRLMGFASALEPADGGRRSLTTVVVTSPDRLDTGWEVVVRVKLLSPANLDTDFDLGPDVTPMLQLVQTIHIVPEGERDDVFIGALIGLEPDAFTVSQQDIAFATAAAAVKRVIGRPLNTGESVTPTRGIFYA